MNGLDDDRPGRLGRGEMRRGPRDGNSRRGFGLSLDLWALRGVGRKEPRFEEGFSVLDKRTRK